MKPLLVLSCVLSLCAASASSALPPPDMPFTPPPQYEGPARESSAEDCAIAAAVAAHLAFGHGPSHPLANPLPPSPARPGANLAARAEMIGELSPSLGAARAGQIAQAGAAAREAFDWRCAPETGAPAFQARGRPLPEPQSIATLDQPVLTRDGRWAYTTYFYSWRGMPQRQEDCLLRKSGRDWRVVRCSGLMS